MGRPLPRQDNVAVRSLEPAIPIRGNRPDKRKIPNLVKWPARVQCRNLNDAVSYGSPRLHTDGVIARSGDPGRRRSGYRSIVGTNNAPHGTGGGWRGCPRRPDEGPRLGHEIGPYADVSVRAWRLQVQDRALHRWR